MSLRPRGAVKPATCGKARVRSHPLEHAVLADNVVINRSSHVSGHRKDEGKSQGLVEVLSCLCKLGGDGQGRHGQQPKQHYGLTFA